MMGDGPEPNGRLRDDSWRVRLRDPRRGPRGGLLGAGVLLGTDLVLTCDHVVADAAAGNLPVRVEFPALLGADAGRYRTAVVEEHVPLHGKHQGDLALLRLTAAAPVTARAGLHRELPPRGTRVFLDGVPVGHSGGDCVECTLMGTGGHGDEWVVLEPVRSELREVRGFSGGGVTVADGGRLLGIAAYARDVDRRPDRRRYRFYMIPAATIAGYLPLVREHYLEGEPATPVQLSVGRPWTGRPYGLQRLVTRWLDRAPGAEDTELLFIGPDDADAHRALHTTLSLADRERLPGLSETAATARASGDGTVPRPGGIQRAVAAAGADAKQLRAELGPYLEERPAGPAPAVALVGLDDSTATYDELVELLRRLGGGGVRLLLVLHRRESGLLTCVARRLGEQWPGAWLGRIGERVKLLAAVERRARELHAYIDPYVLELPDAPARAAAEEVRLTLLEADEQGRPGFLRSLSYVEQEVETALLDAERVVRRLEAGRDRLVLLRRRLGSYQARLADHGRAEEREAAERYQEASRLLTGRCDLDELERAVRGFAEVVERLVRAAAPDAEPEPTKEPAPDAEPTKEHDAADAPDAAGEPRAEAGG